MEEIWKDVPEYEGLYQVSNFGRVKSYDRFWYGKNGKLCVKKSRLMSLQKTAKGYYRVSLRRFRGKTVQKFVHRLVAMAFIQNKDNKPQINHIDGNKINNKICNLEWCTASENQKHNFKIGLSVINTKRCNELNRRFSENEIRLIKRYHHDGLMNIEIAKLFNVNQSQISRIVNEKTYKHLRRIS